MKSEKVKEFIDGCINNLTAELADHAKWQIWTAMTHTADLAEREAEERMREKAIEAFCDECACFEACICCLPAGACDRKNNFIQKLTKK